MTELKGILFSKGFEGRTSVSASEQIDKAFAIKHQDMLIGITKEYITHSQRDKYNYNQSMTPYTAKGRKLYKKDKGMEKKIPLNRPPIYDELTLFQCNDMQLNNFEYYMNREYAYNRDKGRCEICKSKLLINYRHCHRVKPELPINKINKVTNLAWFCYNCYKEVKRGTIPQQATEKMKSKILRYQEHLKVLN